MLESKLMTYIRQFIYDKKYLKMSKEFKCDRILCILVNAYLNKNITDKFLKLFPNFNDEIKLCENIHEKISSSYTIICNLY